MLDEGVESLSDGIHRIYWRHEQISMEKSMSLRKIYLYIC